MSQQWLMNSGSKLGMVQYPPGPGPQAFRQTLLINKVKGPNIEWVLNVCTGSFGKLQSANLCNLCLWQWKVLVNFTVDHQSSLLLSALLLCFHFWEWIKILRMGMEQIHFLWCSPPALFILIFTSMPTIHGVYPLWSQINPLCYIAKMLYNSVPHFLHN